MNCTVILPAAGIGKRFGNNIPKQYLDVDGIPIVIRTLQLFDTVEKVDNILLVIDSEWQSFVENKINKYKVKKYPIFVKGGDERQDSVYNTIGLHQVLNSDIILVHDIVRPFASIELIEKVIKETEIHGAVIPGIPPKDTVKIIEKSGFVDKTISRTILRSIQTPQGFQRDIFIQAYQNAKKMDIKATDDSSLIEKMGTKVKIIDGEETNIKITTPNDMIFAEGIAKKFSGVLNK